MKNYLPRFTVPVVLLLVVSRLAPSDSAAQLPAASSPSNHPASNIPHPTTNQPPSPDSQPSIGDRLLMEAASRLERRGSVTARLRHQVALRDEQLYGVGSYWQEGRGEDLKVRLELQIAGQDSRLLQVSNSRFLWLDRALPAGRTISRIDLRQLRAVLAATNGGEIRPGEASWSPAQTDLTAHGGGLPRLLAALHENFTFLPPQAMRLVPAQGSEATGAPFFAVVGRWRPEKLSALLESQQSIADSRQPSVTSQIPSHLPQEVLLLVDQAELFPYRVEYRRLETQLPAEANGRPIPYQLSPRPLVVLEFSNVVFDAPIAAGQFDYAPPDVNWMDHTAAAVDRITRERQAKIAAQNASQQQTLPAR